MAKKNSKSKKKARSGAEPPSASSKGASSGLGEGGGSSDAAAEILSQGAAAAIWAALGIATLAALYLFRSFVWLEFGPEGFESGCNFSAEYNCDKLNTSTYGKLGGIPITVFAVAAYAAMALLVGLARRGGDRGRAALKLLAVGAAGSVAYGLFLFYVMLAIEKTKCVYCLTMDAAAILTLVLCILALRRSSSRGALDWSGAGLRAGGVGAAALVLGLGVFFFLKSDLQKQQIAQLDAQLASSDASAPGSPGESPATSSSSERAQASSTPAEPGRAYKIRDNYYEVPVTADDPQMGPADPKITVIEFADFECGYCKKLFYSLTPLKEKYKDEVRFVFKHYPMSPACNSNVNNNRHRYACGAAIASECARRQGSFWPMHDLMFKNQHKLKPEDLEYYAKEVGLDMGDFKQCLSDPTAKARVMADADLGFQADVNATPRTFVNGRYLKGVLPTATLEHVIEQELGRRAAGERPQAAPSAPPTTVRPATAPSQVRVDYGSPFWIDSFEASVDAQGRALSSHGVLPANASWYEAKAACEAAGKRMCSTEEWVSACQGAAAVDDDGSGSFADDYIEGNQFPYADYYQPRWCRDSETDKKDATGKVIKEGKPGQTGANPRCATPSGVFDLGGNVTEWVGLTEDEAVLLGGDYRSKDKTGCFRPNPTWGPGHKNIKIGFRCCSDEAVSSEGQAVVSSAPDSMIGRPLPDFEGVGLDGSPIKSSSFRGKVTYLSFYASWCGPCRRELPALRELHGKYEDQGFQVVGVGVDTEARKSRRMAQELGVNYPVLLDPTNAILGLFDVKSMPTTYVIDRSGVIVDKVVGWGKTEEKLPEVMRLVEGLL